MMADPGPPLTITNQSVVTFSDGSSTSFSYSNTVNTMVNGPNFTLELSTTSTQASLGLPITYQITLRNSGNRSGNVTIYDILPPGTTFVANSIIVNGAPIPGITPEDGIPVGDVFPGDTVTVLFQLLLVSVPPSGQLDNTATADYFFITKDDRTITGSVSSNAVSLTVTVLDVTISKSVNSAFTFVGDMLTYSVTIANIGSETLRQSVLIDPLPVGMSFVQGSVTIDGVRSPSSSPITGIGLGNILPSITVQVQFKAIVLEGSVGTLLTNEATLRFKLGIFDQSITSDPVTTIISGPALSVTKSANVAQATVGDTVRYSITIYNGGTTAADVIVRDAIPAGTLFVQGSAVVNGRPLPAANPDNGIALGSLGPGHLFDLSFQVTVTRSVLSPARNELVNRAKVEYSYRLPNGVIVSEAVFTNTVLVALILPVIVADLAAAPPVVVPGELIAVTVRITNTGNYPAAVTLYDLIPSETSLDGLVIYVNGREVSVIPGEGVFIGILDPGATVVITYRLRLSDHPFQSRIRFRVRAVLSYEVNGTLVTNTVYSNEVAIIIETHDE
ncbi:DUF11 domain-containing protein [Paenibacillus sp. OV219]|uniref:DUF11 domain-containing protein n=1 Tax=Paenibacillus sp. OV219 TaxID=1884377 RepID=UPI0008C0560A|nr:DUF11 domain-containing protein [Paenibacillus sp. OV219]SEM90073.1 conserved repeat domain-containing protein [Paenibacillus sp. OV219]